VLPAPICLVTLRKLRFNRLCRLKLPFAVKIDIDFRFEIGIAEGAMRPAVDKKAFGVLVYTPTGTDSFL
jgi:hypothetical protein